MESKWEHSREMGLNCSLIHLIYSFKLYPEYKTFPESLPPQVKFTVTEGAWLVGRQGQLVVQPDARVQLDCVFHREKGTPEWSWENVTQEYKTGKK